MMVAEALGNDLNVMPVALGVEFFHTASLIADDLPCMDNDDERREKPSLHKVYGETVALLSSYAMITAAFETIYENTVLLEKSPSPFKEKAGLVCSLALGVATHCSGILGATGGQFFDLYPPSLTLEMIQEIIYKKTITLFEVSFVLGWLFGGGDINHLDKIKKVAYHMGMAFQIADDIGDIVQDEKKESNISIVKKIGKQNAYSIFLEEMDSFEKGLDELSIYTKPFQGMSSLLRLRASEFMK
jgi:geranylgeranyl diphosphate synthase type II